MVSGSGAIRGVLRNTAFRRLWYCTGLSSLGDWLGLLATTALATQLATGYQAQNYALGGVLVVRLLPSAVLGPLAGAFADRFDRRYTMVVTDLLRFVLFLAIPIFSTLPVLYVATFLIECIGLFWNPAKDAAVPNLVRRDQLEAANQLSLITTYGLTPVLAAALAGETHGATAAEPRGIVVSAGSRSPSATSSAAATCGSSARSYRLRCTTMAPWL